MMKKWNHRILCLYPANNGLSTISLIFKIFILFIVFGVVVVMFLGRKLTIKFHISFIS